jgi:hypothetical protein
MRLLWTGLRRAADVPDLSRLSWRCAGTRRQRLQHHCDRQGRSRGDQAAFRLLVPSARSVPRSASPGGQHRTVGPELPDAHPAGLAARRRQGRAERAASGPARTLSVVFRDFIPHGPRAHGHMTDRACREDRHLATYSQVRRYIVVSGQAVCKAVAEYFRSPELLLHAAEQSCGQPKRHDLIERGVKRSR